MDREKDCLRFFEKTIGLKFETRKLITSDVGVLAYTHNTESLTSNVGKPRNVPIKVGQFGRRDMTPAHTIRTCFARTNSLYTRGVQSSKVS